MVERAIDEVGMAGHIIEREVLFKIIEALKGVNADLTNIIIEIPALRRGSKEKMTSLMSFNLIGLTRKDKEEAFNRIIKVADETGCAITYVKKHD
ncbi:MAG: hypothetical protein ACE5K4_04085 [Candidatus Hydrothermarchaeota archaeon]